MILPPRIAVRETAEIEISRNIDQRRIGDGLRRVSVECRVCAFAGHRGDRELPMSRCRGGPDRRRALDAGYQVHVVKPVESAELIAVVAKAGGVACP